MDATCKQYRYILTMVDGFSKFVWLYLTRTMNTEEVLQKLQNWSSIFGLPSRVVTDRGAAFTAKAQEIRNNAKKAIEQAETGYKEQFDKKSIAEYGYQVGDLVAIKRTQFISGKKLANEFLGPRITKVNRNGRYKVERAADFEAPRVTATSEDNIKLCA
uniref:Integrase catalytic domain-containing protein n=1 Tax=Anopheles funestus TaxID=62324 RepID=A0A182RMF4_ANOFN